MKEFILRLKILAYPFLAFQRGSYGAFVNSILPLYLAGFTTNPATIGLLVTLSAFEGATIPLLIGPLSDRTHSVFGARKIYILFGTVLTSIFFLIFPIIHTLTLIILLIIIMGLTNSINTAPHFAMIAQNSNTNSRTRIVALIAISALIGQIITTVITIIYFGNKISGFTFIVLSILFLIPTVPLLIFSNDIKKPINSENRLNINTLKQFIGNKTRNIYMLSQLVLWFGINSALPFFTLFVKNYLLLSIQQALIFYLVLVVASGLFAFPFALLAKRWGETNILRVGLIFLLVGGFLGIFAKEIPQVLQYTIALCAGIGNAAIAALSFSILSKLVPDRMLGTAGGVQSFLIAGFAPVAAFISGKIISEFGYSSIFVILSITTVISIFLISFVTSNKINEVMESN